MSADLIHRKRVLNNQDYILSMRAVFNVRALYSATTSNYLKPEEPEAGDEITVTVTVANPSFSIASVSYKVNNVEVKALMAVLNCILK